MSKIANIIGDRLRHRRLELKYSQETVAEKAGLHPTYIGQVERGEKNATIESIEKLCIALNYPMDELFSKIISTSDKNITANECYSLIISQSPKEQQMLYELLRQIIEFKQKSEPPA